MHDLGTLGTRLNSSSQANGINRLGQVVGSSTSAQSSAQHAFLYDGTMHDLGTLGGSSTAYSINSVGEIVGYSEVNQGADQHAFLYYGGLMTDLNSVLPLNSGWDLQQANSINNVGQIAGTGTLNGQTHAYLLTPTTPLLRPPSITIVAPPSNPGIGVAPNNAGLFGHLKQWNGVAWTDVNAVGDITAPGNPTVVIAHGWHDSSSDAWVATMASRLKLEALAAGISAPNILAWDWSGSGSLGSTPGNWGDGFGSLGLEIETNGLKNAAKSASNGDQQGKLLALDLALIGIHPDTLQLIGHSNGSAVVGSAAKYFRKTTGSKVQQVTLLDAPDISVYDIAAAGPNLTFAVPLNPFILNTSVNSHQYIDASAAQTVENYYSSDRVHLGFGAPLGGSTNNIFNGSVVEASQLEHSRLTSWYSNLALQGDAGTAAINWSILSPTRPARIASGFYAEQGSNTGLFVDPPASLDTQAFQSSILEDFDHGGNWNGQNAQGFSQASGFAMKISGGTGGNLFKQVTIPEGAQFITFDFNVDGAGAGDYMTLSFGGQILGFEMIDMVTGGFIASDPIYVGDLNGQTDTLLFALNSQSTPDGSILLDNIQLLSVPEPSTVFLLAGAALAAAIGRRRVY